MTQQQEAQSRMLNRLMKADKRLFVPLVFAQKRRPFEAHCVAWLRDVVDASYFLALNQFGDRRAVAELYSRKYSEAISRMAPATGVSLQVWHNAWATRPVEAETTEMQAAALEIARTKATLKFSGELYGKQKAETGLTSAQQFLAFKQAQREQQSE